MGGFSTFIVISSTYHSSEHSLSALNSCFLDHNC